MPDLGAAVERIRQYIETEKRIYGETLFLKDLILITESKSGIRVEYKNELNLEQDKEKVDAIVFYQNNIGMLRPYTTDEILNWIEDTSDEIVIYALKMALEQNKPSWGYAKAILQQWHSNNIRTVEQIEAAQLEFQNRKKWNNNNHSIGTGSNDPEWFKNKEHEIKQFVNGHTKDATGGADEKKLQELMKAYKGE